VEDEWDAPIAGVNAKLRASAVIAARNTRDLNRTKGEGNRS